MNSPIPELTMIHSAHISIPNGEKIPVSKELLVLSSEFFRSLFEGNYAEKKTGIFEIKDVEPEEFRWFVDSLHSRKWEFSSGEHEILSLRYADLYALLRLHQYILPYLKSNRFYKIRTEYIEDKFLLCSRFHDSCELLRWVLSNVETDREMFDLVYRCVPLMQTTNIQAAIKALEKSVIALKKQEISEEKLNVLMDTRKSLSTSGMLSTAR
ncbi:hypothetical protein PRIPAC_81129 [Pristionchus pacificus]|nr:hypothetical protein PRIPAC_81129 [Pristionchus pacificus]